MIDSLALQNLELGK